MDNEPFGVFALLPCCDDGTGRVFIVAGPCTHAASSKS